MSCGNVVCHSFSPTVWQVIDCPAPPFTKKALLNGEIVEVSLSDYLGKYVVLFFYPLDFTFVCPTEIIEFDKKLEEFEERGCVLLGASVDSEFVHRAWSHTPRTEGGIGKIRFPLISDLSKSMCRDYGVLCKGEVAFRGLFIVDKKGIVRSFLVNGLDVGRSVDEVLRLVDAFQFVDHSDGSVCPVNWKKGSQALVADTEGLLEFMSDMLSDDESD